MHWINNNSRMQKMKLQINKAETFWQVPGQPSPQDLIFALSTLPFYGAPQSSHVLPQRKCLPIILEWSHHWNSKPTSNKTFKNKANSCHSLENTYKLQSLVFEIRKPVSSSNYAVSNSLYQSPFLQWEETLAIFQNISVMRIDKF